VWDTKVWKAETSSLVKVVYMLLDGLLLAEAKEGSMLISLLWD